MNELTVGKVQLPETVEQKAKYILFGTEALKAYRAKLSAMQKLGISRGQYDQLKLEAQETAENVLLFSMDVGEHIATLPKAVNNNPSGKNQHVGQIEPKGDLTTCMPKQEAVRELGFTQKQSEQFQKMAKHPEIVKEAIAEAKENDEIPTRSMVLDRIDKFVKKPHVLFNSGNNEWYTPSEYIEAATEVMGSIDLDPASSDIANDVVKAAKYYTVETNGLDREWAGNIWLNPPYSTDLIGKFTEKLVAERKHYSQAIVLVNNATETEWFGKIVGISSAVCFPQSRVKFYTPDGKTGAPLQGQAVLYIGERQNAFLDGFRQFGWGALLDGVSEGKGNNPE